MTIQNKIIATATIALLTLSSVICQGQQKTDTLILNVGKSKILFLINDHADLKSMQAYDLNQILDQLSVKLTGDSTLVRPDGTAVEDTTVIVNENKVSDKDAIEEKTSYNTHKRKAFSTFHSINFDIGTNNYVNDGKFPDETNELYSVKPFGSWYVGISSIYKTYIAGPVYLEWGAGVSWYNFKFENTATRLVDTPDGVSFLEVIDPNISFEKSKLTVAYVHASFVPMLDFGKQRQRDTKFWRGDKWNNHDNRGFRIGFGGYAGYKIDSYTKVVIDNGDNKKQRNHDNFHLENFRYGARVQLGYRGTDIFFNYDLNELFAEDKGPKLNAFSFGIIL